ncbi:MAG: FAD-dependent pyridine nucleotide-disulfide oxidoreductase [Parcubacteria group bacterium GW2011_GWA2_47_7]|nr:MAG: FAD-dependent pyridine nucleotide-disulfide oxidoreductase [Parcubacteria group bacterium GW2011_GWA2_47_7]
MKSEDWYTTNNITLLTGCAAVALDATAKQVTLSDGKIFQYEKLLIATGTHNRKWTIPGANKKSVHYLRTLDHAKAIIKDLHDGKSHAVIVGSACVTYEVADILRSKEIEVTEVMREHYFWEPALSQDEASIVEERLVERGVTLIRDMEITEVIGGDEVEGVILKDGRMLHCDMVFAFIGVDIPTNWLISSGITLDRGIHANQYLETSLPDVWVAGDTARYKDVILNDSVVMGNWMNATKQGETAAMNMLGDKKGFELVSFHSSHGFGDMISFAGDGRAKEDREYIMRGNISERKYGRIILCENHIVGATMINRTQELTSAARLQYMHGLLLR